MKNSLIKTLFVLGATLILTSCASLQVKKVENEALALQSDALFGFDKASVDDLSAEGRLHLDALAQAINEGQKNIKAIELIGHTDRIGNKIYNQQLSENRATSVMHYLESRGVQVPMSALGAGSENPVTTECTNIRGNALISCLQPDRRVEVKVEGRSNLQERLKELVTN